MQTKDAVSIEVAGLVYRYRNAVQSNPATSEFQDDITGNLIRQSLGSFDGYQSRENAKQNPSGNAAERAAGVLQRIGAPRAGSG